MKNMKKIIPFIMVMALTCTSLPLVAKADSSRVVTLGANLSAEQKTSMYEFFGTSADKVDTIEVTNTDERKYMEGIATEAQIGTRTYSCSYVEPTTEGGIQVKVANLTFVTSSMIASTLLTSGVENCNVVAASPIEVSGTGALTGIMMAYESASGETLDEGQKSAATQELVTTGELADSIGQEQATELMNDVKESVIEDNLTDPAEITEAINDAADDLNVSLTEDQLSKISSLMQTISQYDYDVNALKDTLDNLEGKSEGFFSKLWSSIKGIFSGGDSDGGIINNTDDSILGDSAVIDSTLDSIKSAAKDAEEEGLWDKIVNFFKGLFGGDEEDSNAEDTTTDDAATNDNSGSSDTADSSDSSGLVIDDSGDSSGNSTDSSSTDGGNTDGGSANGNENTDSTQ